MPRTRPLRAAFHRPLRAATPSGESTLTVRGEVDFLTVEQLCARIRARAAGERRLALDLTGATFYDRCAVETLAAACADVRDAGCRVTLTRAPEGVAAGPDPAR